MLSQLYFNSCVQLWMFFAQVPGVATGTPAAASPAATAASPHATVVASPAAAATTLASPAAAASTVATPVAASGVPAATIIPIAPGTGMPVDPNTLPGVPGIETTLPPVAQPLVHTIFHGVLLLLFFLVCLGLILCVLFQTTKNEGLSGVIGGTVSSSLSTARKKSSEEMLSTWTSRLAVSFVVLSLLIWLLFGRH